MFYPPYFDCFIRVYPPNLICLAASTLASTAPGGADGSNPDSVVLDGAGHIYGTAANGGGKCRDQGYGVVFKITFKPHGIDMMTVWRNLALSEQMVCHCKIRAHSIFS